MLARRVAQLSPWACRKRFKSKKNFLPMTPTPQAPSFFLFLRPDENRALRAFGLGNLKGFRPLGPVFPLKSSPWSFLGGPPLGSRSSGALLPLLFPFPPGNLFFCPNLPSLGKKRAAKHRPYEYLSTRTRTLCPDLFTRPNWASAIWRYE